jgi:outer membrane protein assembly factor BamB
MPRLLLATILASSLFAGDASMFRGDPAHLGVYTSAISPTLAAVLWKFQTKGKVISCLAVATGTVYFGSSDGKMYALVSATSVMRWSAATSGPVTSSPLVAAGVVYFGSVDGWFYALDATNGKLIWKFQTGRERRLTAPGTHGILPKKEMMPDPLDLFPPSPTLANGIYFGSGDHNVYALDAHTGALIWKFSSGNVIHESPAVAGGVLYKGNLEIRDRR